MFHRNNNYPSVPHCYSMCTMSLFVKPRKECEERHGYFQVTRAWYFLIRLTFFSQWITLTSSMSDLFITSQCRDILQLVYQLSDQDVLRNSGAFFFLKKESYMDGSAARNQRRQLFYWEHWFNNLNEDITWGIVVYWKIIQWTLK